MDENINGPLFSTLFEYDAFSNLAKETYPGGLPAGQAGFAVFHDYDINGYHFQIRRVDNNQIIYQNLSMNALGQYNNFVRGIGLATTKLFDDFGFPIAIAAPGIQDLHYTFDPQNSNLIDRADNIHLLTETFTYDNLDRLKTFSFGGLTVNYLDNGNIQNKSDAGSSYVYDPVKIHALKKINNPTINISQSIQNISYSSFQKAQTITEDTYQLDFTYGPDDERKKTTLKNNSVLQSTRYFSGDYEKTIAGSNTIEVNYINCSSGLAAMYVTENGVGSMYYPFTDHLGSILKITDQNGNSVAEQSFDACLPVRSEAKAGGRNRNPSDWIYSNIPTIPAWLYRGYTGHEHLPQFALINMNGRMYDPVVGRMLSPDNNLQAPDNSQNHNRYSYALNNPLKYIDPSGMQYGDVLGGSSWDDYPTATGLATRENIGFESIFNFEFDREQFRFFGESGATSASGINYSLKPVWTGEKFELGLPNFDKQMGDFGYWGYPDIKAKYSRYEREGGTRDVLSEITLENWKWVSAGGGGKRHANRNILPASKHRTQYTAEQYEATERFTNTVMNVATAFIPVGRVVSLGGLAGKTSSVFSYIGPKITNQMINRGWTKELIHQTVNKSFTTRVAIDKATNEAATAFFTREGSYVVRNNLSGKIVQVSDRTRPWSADQAIVNPYIPK